MQKTDRLFSQIYSIDQSTGCYMIEVRLTDYADIFNEWDPAPFKRRDIDPDLMIYLEECSAEIPFRQAIEICFVIPAQIQNQQMEAEACSGIANSFIYDIHTLKTALKEVRLNIFRFVLFGFIFLGLADAIAEQPTETMLPSLLVQGIAISGWFFLGEAGTLIFFFAP